MVFFSVSRLAAGSGGPHTSVSRVRNVARFGHLELSLTKMPSPGFHYSKATLSTMSMPPVGSPCSSGSSGVIRANNQSELNAGSNATAVRFAAPQSAFLGRLPRPGKGLPAARAECFAPVRQALAPITHGPREMRGGSSSIFLKKKCELGAPVHLREGISIPPFGQKICEGFLVFVVLRFGRGWCPPRPHSSIAMVKLVYRPTLISGREGPTDMLGLSRESKRPAQNPKSPEFAISGRSNWGHARRRNATIGRPQRCKNGCTSRGQKTQSSPQAPAVRRNNLFSLAAPAPRRGFLSPRSAGPYRRDASNMTNYRHGYHPPTAPLRPEPKRGGGWCAKFQAAKAPPWA